MGVLTSRTVFRIHYRLSFEYLALENATKDIRLGAKPWAKGLKRPSSLSISLSMREKAKDVGAIESAIEDAIEA